MTQALTIKSLLTHPRTAQVIKYTVYSALVVNFGFYAYDDWMAYRSALADDAAWSDISTQFATTIDMAGWVGLVFLFELETYALPDHAFKVWVTRALHAGRIVCYLAILFGAYGYTAEAIENYDSRIVPGLTDLCEIADQDKSLQIDSITYVKVTSDNCAALSAESAFYQIGDEVSVIDQPTLAGAKFQGWLDVENAIIWLIVVWLIEFEVWLQSNDRFGSRSLRIARRAKSFFYALLIANIVIWWVTDYFLYTWDAFLWIFGFWAIELNLAEWERDRTLELAAEPAPA